MPLFGSGREKYLLTVGILSLRGDNYAFLFEPGQLLHLMMTNLRNRPLSSTSVDSMTDSVLALYHNLLTGSKDFPLIPYKGCSHSILMHRPFGPEEQRENTAPSPPMEEPPGLMVPPAGSRLPPLTILTPVHPEKADLDVLKADRRNYVCHVEVDGRTVTRFISPVYCTESSELTNCWRVSDYRKDGQVLMSVLCRFLRDSTACANTARQGTKRTHTEEESSLPSPQKRLRL